MNLNSKEEIQKAYSANFGSDENDIKHETSMLMYRFLSEIERLSEEKSLNRKELATAIGTSASYITQLFRGNKIINLETIAKFQKIFDVKFEIKAISNDAQSVVFDFDLNKMNNNADEVKGFWAFHNFKADYKNNSFQQIEVPKIEKITA